MKNFIRNFLIILFAVPILAVAVNRNLRVLEIDYTTPPTNLQLPVFSTTDNEWNPQSIAAVLDDDLDAIAALAGTSGGLYKIAANTWALRTLQAPAAGLTIANPAGVAGDPTFALANDLLALEGLSGTGVVSRTGTDTFGTTTLGTANQVFGVNAAGNGNEYKSFATGTSGTDFAVAHSANTITLNLPDASGSNRGAVTTGSQTFAGEKTFTDSPVLSSTTASRPLKVNAGKNIISAVIDLADTNDIGGILGYANGGTGISGIGTANQIIGANAAANGLEYKGLGVSDSGTDFGISHSAGGIQFDLPDAGASSRGVVTTDAQTFAGNKTLSGTTNLSALTASRPLKLDSSKNITSTQIDLTESDDVTETRGGWIEAGVTFTYASATTFTISGDWTNRIFIGTKVELTQTSAKYFYVTASSHSSGTTTVTVNGGSDYSLANAAITTPYYSNQASPDDFPQRFAYSPTPTGFSANPTFVAGFTLIGRRCFVDIRTSSAGTSNATSFTISLPITAKTVSNMFWVGRGYGVDNGAYQHNVLAEIGSAGTTMSLSRNDGNVWTNSGNKSATLHISYDI